ncbi:MAG TPA: MBG domain-containing protein [Rhizomicrobium sp.]|nr:MBG domain-containing protein [Rhizomicrobium sp.]
MRSQKKYSGLLRCTTALTLVLLTHGTAIAGDTLPNGGKYVAGHGTIAASNGSMVVDQTTNRGIIDWKGFSIGAGNSVQFNNGNGATLNRVTGGSLTTIEGQLGATGSVYVINPQGVVIGPNGKVVTNGSFVASTRGVSNGAFMNGSPLSAKGNSSGDVVNQGAISSTNGDVILFGRSVTNGGSIKAPNGTAGLAAGNSLLLRPANGDPRIAVSGGTGSVTQSGTVAAAQAELSAAGGNVYAIAGNGGTINATGTTVRGGHVWLTAGGTTQVAGTITAANANGSGGAVVVTGHDVSLGATASISADGTSGGTILIGGDQAGGSDPARKRVSVPVATAQTTTIASGAQVSADGTVTGGAVVIWSDIHTDFEGALSARGGAGDGGFAEVSSHGLLDFLGATDLSSAHGADGDLLLDPHNVTIVSGTGGTISAGAYTPTVDDSQLGATTLASALASANVTVGTGSTGTQAGNITVSAAVNWTGNHSLTLTAGTSGAIAVNAAITATGTAGNTKTITLNGGTGGITTSATISTTYNGSGTGITLSTTGAVTVGGALTANSINASGTGIAIVAPAGIAINGALSATPAIISLKAGDNSNTAATVTEGAGGSIAASKLRLWSAATAQANAGSFTLNGSTNAITTLAASVANLSFTNNKALIVGTVTTVGLTVAGDSSLTTTAGAITVSSAQTVSTANTLTLTSAAGITLNAATTANTGTLALSANGAVTQSTTAANAIKVANLALLGGSGASYTLANTSNKASALAVDANAATFQDSSALTIGSVGSQNGITAAGAVAIGSAGSITVSQDIAETGSGAITITADTGHTGTGTITWSGARAFSSNAAISAFANGYSGATPGFSGSGTFNAFTTISTLAGLEGIANNLSGSYALMADVDASAAGNFTPIGTLANPFTGAFDGQGHVISNLTIADSSGNPVGLFGAIGSGALVKNIGIVSGSISGSGSAGAIVGENLGGTIGTVFSLVPVTSTNGSAGGLVGHMQGGTITTAFSTGDVNGVTAGGLIGAFDSGTVGQTYASGAVTGATAGGLYGTLGSGTTTASYYDTTINPTLDATGAGGATGASGLTSTQFAATTSFSGWTFGTTAGTAGWVIVDADATLNNAGGAAGGTRPMFLTSAAAGTGTLTITNGLQLQLVALNLDGSYNLGGNIDMNAVGITKASGLWLGQGFVPLGSATSDPTSIPAFVVYATTNAYTGGTFDGKNFTISNHYITRPNQDFVGLFGYTDGATIQNLTVSGNVTGRDFTGGIVGDEGYQPTESHTTDIESTNAAVNVTGRDYTGGMVGYADIGTINNFFTHVMGSTGNVSGRNYTGGFIGYMNDASTVGILNIYATGNVTGYDDVGGLVGWVGGTLTTNGAGWQTYATGNVSGHDNVGGYAGFAGAASINPEGGAAYATGNVTGNQNIGGFVGYVDYGSEITQSFATGNVAGVTNVGGFVGNNASETTNESNIEVAFAEGSVTGTTNVGGFAGYNINGIFDAYAVGAVNGTTDVGGFVGLNDSQLQTSPTNSFPAYVAFGHIVGTYATGDVQGATNAGGFAGANGADTSGHNQPATIADSWFDTTTSGTTQGLGAANGTTTTIGSGTTTQLTAMTLSQYVFSSSDWTKGAFPVLSWLYPSGADTLFGTVQSGVGDTSVEAGVRVEARVSGLSGTALAAAAGVGSSGADGTYWVNLPSGTASATHDYLFSTGDGATFVHDQSSATARTITGDALTDVAAANESTTLSVLATDAAALVGSNTTLATLLATRDDRILEADGTASLDIDQALSTRTLEIAAPGFGTVTQSKSIDADLLLMSTNVGATALTDSGNTIAKVDGSLGTLSLYTSGALTVGTSGGGVSAFGGDVTLHSGGDLTLASGVTMNSNNLVLATDTHFINDVAGVEAISTSGRWIVYSADPAGDSFGTSMDSENTAIWGSTLASAAPGTLPSGNRYVFATPAAITLTLGSIEKTYGDDVTAALAGYTLSGFRPGVANAFEADDATTAISGTPVLTSAGAAATAQVTGSPYAIAVDPLSATALDGYTFAVSGTITVDAKALTITAHDANKTYGDTPDLGHSAFDAGGLVNGDTVTTVDLASTGTAATATVDGGPYAIVASNAAGTGLDNYTISYVNGALTVDAKALTITAHDTSKTYGDTPDLGHSAVDTDGLINGDAVTSVDLSSTGTAGTATVAGGPYAIVASNAAGTGLDNYTISYINGALTVDAKALTITAHDANKTYGDTPDLGHSAFDTDGLINGDAVTSVDLASTGTAATATVDGGPYAIVASNASGTGLDNYTISYVSGALTVDAKALTITARDMHKTYGDSATLAYDAGGLINGDTVTSVDLSSTGAAATATVAATPYAITASNAQGTGLDNYAITYAGGALTVDQKDLTITIHDLSKVYGDTMVFNGKDFDADGLVNGDTVRTVNMMSGGIGGTAAAAQYAITGDGVHGTGMGNYAITYAAGTLTVDPRTLTITILNETKTSGVLMLLNPQAFTASGLVNGDTVRAANLTSTGIFASAAPGQYAILGAGAHGTGLSNYTLVFVNGTLTVAPRAVSNIIRQTSYITGDRMARAE